MIETPSPQPLFLYQYWALLAGWAAGTFAGTAMAVATKLTAAFPLVVGGHTFPGYTAVYTVVPNLMVAAVLTPVFNAMSPARAGRSLQLTITLEP